MGWRLRVGELPAVRRDREFLDEGATQIKLLIGSYQYLFNEPLYVSSWGYSIMVAGVSTVLCLCLGYPMAYAIARSTPTYRNVFLMLIILLPRLWQGRKRRERYLALRQQRKRT